MINLPNTYTITNSTDVAQNLTQLPYKHDYRLLTLYIKDLYVNIPTKEIMHVTHKILQYNHTERTLQQQTLLTLNAVLQQYYFQHNNNIYQPTKGVAMGSPISGLITEIFFQHFENLIIKHPSIHRTTAPFRPWPPSKVASICPYFPLFSSIIASLISVMHPSAQHPPIWFLVFPVVWCYGISRSDLFLVSLIIKHHIENKSLIFYTRYVGDILIIYDWTRIECTQIVQHVITIHNNLTFNCTLETDGSINFLDLLIHRTNINTEIEIYRKSTTTNTIIHFTSNHTYVHKIATFRFLLTRMQLLPLTPQYKQTEWRNILHIAKTNGYALSTITKLSTRIQNKLHNSSVTNEHSNNKNGLHLHITAPWYAELRTYFMTQT
jgi:hypothetical protein